MSRARAAVDRVVARLGAEAGSRGAISNGGPDTSTFLRGLVVGALVGAAIAGSTIWERRRVRQRIRHELAAADRAAGDT